MRRIGHLTVIALATLLVVAGESHAQPSDASIVRPSLPEPIAAEIAELAQQVSALQVAHATGEIDTLDDAIEMAERILELRIEYQANRPGTTRWRDSAGTPTEWYEVIDARHRLTNLIAQAALTDENRHLSKQRRDLTLELRTAYSAGAFDRCVPIARKILDLNHRITGPDHRQAVVASNNVAFMLLQTGRLAESETQYRDTVTRGERVLGPEHPETVNAVNGLGQVLHDRGKFGEAKATKFRAWSSRKHVFGAAHVMSWSSLNNIGVLLTDMDQPHEAEAFLRASLRLARDLFGDDHRNTFAALNNLGYLLGAHGRKPEAATYFQASLAGKQAMLGDDHPSTLRAASNLGHAWLHSGRVDEAMPLLDATLQGRQRALGPDHPETLLSMHILGRALLEQGRYDEAEAHILATLNARIVVLGESHFHVHETRVLLGDLYTQLGRWDEADTQLVTALNHPNAFGGSEGDRLWAMRHLAELHTRRGHFDEAEATYRAALTLAQSRRGWATADERSRAAQAESDRLPDLAASLAVLLARRNALEEAWSTLEIGRGRSLLDLVTEVETRPGVTPDDPAILAARETEDAARTALIDAEARLGAMRRSPEDGRDADAITTQEQHIQDLRLRLAEAASDLQNAVRTAIPDAQPLTFEQIRARLEPGDLLLGFVWTDHAVVLLHATTDDVSATFLADTEEAVQQLAARIAEVRDHLSTRPVASSLDLESDLEALRAQLFPPALAPVLNTFTTAIVLPDGPLNELPLEMVIEANSDRVERNVVYASSATVFLNRRALGRDRQTQVASNRVVAVGGAVFEREGSELDEDAMIVSMLSRDAADATATVSAIDQVRLYGATLSPLPFTRAEAIAVTSLARQTGRPTTRLVGDDASVPQLEAAVADARYLHIATHGLVGSQTRPYDASLALSLPANPTPDDFGFLTLDRLMRTWRGRLASCDLVVLSACDTQRGVRQGDALMTLPWGFFYAGAPTVVASLWAVDDAATAKLMTRFYGNLLGAHDEVRTVRDRSFGFGEPMPKADALAEAKHWLRTLEVDDDRGVGRGGTQDATVRPYEHPYYWAPFVLLGDPG